MSISVVWLDLEHAKIFHLSDDRMEREELRAKHVDHHTHRRNQDEREPVMMYDQVAQRVREASRILILGPGLAKVHLLQRLKEKFPLLAKKVVGCETSDHPTDGQIAAYAQKYIQRRVG